MMERDHARALFSDYLDDVLLPYWKTREPGTTRGEAILADIQAAYEAGDLTRAGVAGAATSGGAMRRAARTATRGFGGVFFLVIAHESHTMHDTD